MDPLSAADTFHMLNAGIGIKNFSMGAQIGSWLASKAGDDPFYLPPNFDNQPWVSELRCALAMLGASLPQAELYCECRR
jgi:hypothetical protein